MDIAGKLQLVKGLGSVLSRRHLKSVLVCRAGQYGFS